MAQIKMDVSEYNEIMDSRKLLKDSLEREKELNQEIDRLNKEKIQALEDAKMKVVKITQHKKTEYVFVKNQRANELLYRTPAINGKIDLCDYRTIDALISALFEKRTSEEISEPEITTHGLDEIKEELREDIWNEIDRDVKRKVSAYDQHENEKSRLMKEIEELRSEVGILNNYLESSKKEASEFGTKHSLLRHKISDISVVLGNMKRFNKGKTIKEIIKIINR